MKVENFEAAVHFYGKAIELNPANAVYFCNRYQPGLTRGGDSRGAWAGRSRVPRRPGEVSEPSARGCYTAAPEKQSVAGGQECVSKR